jgi:prepilin-type N-terminal cleavage/methylation domain-containing protein
MHSPTSPNLKSGFSLIELIVVIAVVASLALLVLAGLQKVSQSAKQTKCLSNLRQIGIALTTYANEHDQRFPLTVNPSKGYKTWDQELLDAELLAKEIFISPSDDIPRTISGDPRSYGYNGYVGDAREDGLTVNGYVMQINKNLAKVILVANRTGPTAIINRADYASAYRNADCIRTYDYKGANYVFVDLHAEWLENSGDYGQPDDSEAGQRWKSHWPCRQ